MGEGQAVLWLAAVGWAGVFAVMGALAALVSLLAAADRWLGRRFPPR